MRGTIVGYSTVLVIFLRAVMGLRNLDRVVFFNRRFSSRHLPHLKSNNFHGTHGGLMLFGSMEEEWDYENQPKTNFTEDYYSVLEVDPSCTQEELREAYLRLMKKYNPEGNRAHSEKTLTKKQILVINNAYSCLRDKDLRVLYDKRRKQDGGSTRQSDFKKQFSSSTSTFKAKSSDKKSITDWSKYYQPNNDDTTQSKQFTASSQASSSFKHSQTSESFFGSNRKDLLDVNGFEDLFGKKFFMFDITGYRFMSLRSLVIDLKDAIRIRDEVLFYLKDDTTDWSVETNYVAYCRRVKEVEQYNCIMRHIKAIEENILDCAHPLTLEEAIASVENGTHENYDSRTRYYEPQTSSSYSSFGGGRRNGRRPPTKVADWSDLNHDDDGVDYNPSDDLNRWGRSKSDSYEDPWGGDLWRESQRRRRRGW